MKKNWKRGPRYKCCFWKCNHTERTDSKIKLIQNLPKNVPSLETARLRDVTRYLKKKLERQFILKACSKKDEGRRYYLCTHHDMELVTKKTIIKRKIGTQGREKKFTIKHTFFVPSGIRINEYNDGGKRKSKGLGADRMYARTINNIATDITSHHSDQINPSGEYQNLLDVATDNTKLVFETFAKNDELEAENERLRKENEELKNEKEHWLETGCYEMNDKTKKGTIKSLPIIIYLDLVNNDFEVKRRTGFKSLDHLLAYILIVCNGDVERVQYKNSSLTWLEEWFFFFEFIWGRTLNRWIDAAAVYKTHITTVRNIFDKKIKMLETCRISWPRYASYNEDHTLTKQKWRDKFEGKRIVMWDDTNVNLTYKPSGADEQRLTYSLYYGGNCAKGGVFLQLCGWIGVEHLWVGTTSDSFYQEKTKIFEKQDAFAKSDLVHGKLVPFSNILDKGYRVNVPAWRAGRQEIIQPIFATSDRRFSGRDTIHTADVATTRSGNERGVNRSKLSGYIKRGIRQTSNATAMDNVWMTWAFQTNFMYKSVL